MKIYIPPILYEIFTKTYYKSSILYSQDILIIITCEINEKH